MFAEDVLTPERQLRLYEAITSSTPDLIYVFDLKYRFIYANAALLQMWGKTWAQSIGKGLLENGYEPWHAEMHEREIDQVVATRQPIRGAVHFPHAEKGKRYYDYILVPVLNERGEVEAVAGTTRDITDIKLAEEQLLESRRQLEQSEQNLRNIILQAPVAMCIMMGQDHVVDIANEEMIRLWGKPREAVMNRPIFEGLPDARAQGLEELIGQVYRTGEPFYAAERPVELLRDGRRDTVYQNFAYVPYMDPNGSILGVMAISVDVTPQVEARQQIEEVVNMRTRELAASNGALQNSVAALQRSNANLEDFTYAASHDLKEPVRKITTFASRLQAEMAGRLTEAEARLLERIQSGAERMRLLIDDLLEYSHVSFEGHAPERIDLNEKLHRVLSDLELLIEEKGARIEVGHLPVVQGKRRQIQQLFQNLVSNALKYAKPGVAPEISITSREVAAGDSGLPAEHLPQGTRFHLIEVADNGIGFEQDQSEKIFKIFHRLHGKEEYSGTGVGLAIVRKVVENHGGAIWAEGEPGKGAKFKVLLPVSE
ncbi:sensor histidine kinase [Flaviaesturariibacter amylovorans]|uniref:histidine kinase n=1 Tax=Flaviaesturariibacter amylovorans TaxID=1084520 RepID=A0ABP8HI27_9BACT